MSSLLATKLYCPSFPEKRVQRPLLIQRLTKGLESGHQITLVSAPAGFGKTTCISEWVNALDVPSTWLSLDPADDDPGRFFTYLVAALQKVDSNLGQEIAGVLRAGQLPPSEIISTTLINDILDLDNQFLLILDDFQVLQDHHILHVLEDLVTNLFQVNLHQPLHLVLLTREDPPLPLARLRANNQLTELRAGDLRFSISEAEHFLNEVMGLSLSQEDITLLEERTEGWIVGLQLAAIAMQSPSAIQSPLSDQDRADPSGFIATLSGSHRFILSYLTEEVLNQQPEDIQQFLLQTSILDRLSGDLCNAVTDRADSRALLEQLSSANLFLIPLDNEQRWYRYHQLFADLLRDRQYTLQKGEIAELHRRASHWYIQAGMVSEAIEHALAAADYTMAVHLIESHATDMLMQWHVKTVDGWLQAIPPEWTAQSPRANLAFAWMYLMRANHAQALPYFERLGAMFSDPQVSGEDPSLEAKWLALQSMLLNAQGKQTESLQLCNRALEIVPQDDGQVRSMIYLALANAYQQLDNYDRSVEAFQEIIRIGQTAGNSISELLGISGLALLALQHGQYHFAFEIVTQGIERIERTGSLPPISTAVYGELAVIYYQWYQLEQAHKYFRRAIQVSTLSGYSDAELYYGVILSRLFQLQGDLDVAAREIQKVVDLMQVEPAAAVREEVISQQIRIYLAQDDLASAEMLLDSQGFSLHGKLSFPDPESERAVPMSSRDDSARSAWILYISALRILLYRARTKHELADLKPGIKLASYLIDGALQHQYIPFALETLLVRAQMHAVIGNERASQADYVHALELAEPEGFISIFVEEGTPIAEALTNLLGQNQLGTVQPGYVKDILAALAESQTSAVEDTTTAIALLTDRELDALRLIAQGLTYEEIAQRLFISLNTVRSHVKAIYSKLDVNNRTKAIEKAHQLKIL